MPRTPKSATAPEAADAMTAAMEKKATGRKPAAKKMSQPRDAAMAPVKERKPYPTREQRILLADEQIKTLTKLSKNRKVLVEKTEKLLQSRQRALEKCQMELDRAIEKKERLQMTPEARAQARLAKAAEKKETALLMSAVKRSGKSVDDLLSWIREEEGGQPG